MLQEIRLSQDQLKIKENILKKELSIVIDQIAFLDTKVEELYHVLNKYSQKGNKEARNQQIYIEKTIYGWSNEKISVNHGGIERTTIYKIIKEIEENFESSTKFNIESDILVK